MDFLRYNGVWTDGASEIETFQIQENSRDREVPHVVAEEAYKEYKARYGGSQTLERLGERGGFGSSELAILLYQRIKRLEQAKA